jgi:hypothetical protein
VIERRKAVDSKDRDVLLTWKNFGDFEGTKLVRVPVKNVDDPESRKDLRNDVSFRRRIHIFGRQHLVDSFEEVELFDAVVQVDKEDPHLVAAQSFWKNDSANCLDKQNWKRLKLNFTFKQKSLNNAVLSLSQLHWLQLSSKLLQSYTARSDT